MIESLCRVQVYLRREETLQPAQVALIKMSRNEAKIYQETRIFLTLKDIYLLHVFFPDFNFIAGRYTGKHDLRSSRFVCELSRLISFFFRKSRMVAPFVFKIKTWQVLRTFCFIVLTEFQN